MLNITSQTFMIVSSTSSIKETWNYHHKILGKLANTKALKYFQTSPLGQYLFNLLIFEIFYKLKILSTVFPSLHSWNQDFYSRRRNLRKLGCLFIYSIYMSILSECMDVQHMIAEACKREEWAPIPWKWSCRWLWADMQCWKQPRACKSNCYQPEPSLQPQENLL